MLEKCCYVANELNAPIVVVHPSAFYIPEEAVDEIYEKLMHIADDLRSMAKRYNIKFALENLHPASATDVLKRALDSLEPEYFGLCYDVTHAQVDGSRRLWIMLYLVKVS